MRWSSCAAASASMDALEDTTECCLWQWELRDVKAIPKALKPAAKHHKKLMHKVCDSHISLLRSCQEHSCESRDGCMTACCMVFDLQKATAWQVVNARPGAAGG